MKMRRSEWRRNGAKRRESREVRETLGWTQCLFEVGQAGRVRPVCLQESQVVRDFLGALHFGVGELVVRTVAHADAVGVFADTLEKPEVAVHAMRFDLRVREQPDVLAGFGGRRVPLESKALVRCEWEVVDAEPFHARLTLRDAIQDLEPLVVDQLGCTVAFAVGTAPDRAPSKPCSERLVFVRGAIQLARLDSSSQRKPCEQRDEFIVGKNRVGHAAAPLWFEVVVRDA